MFILSIGDLSEKFMDFTFDMYFRQARKDRIMQRMKTAFQTWYDQRLTFDKQPELDKLMVSCECKAILSVAASLAITARCRSGPSI
jgi:hypothetical protein